MQSRSIMLGTKARRCSHNHNLQCKMQGGVFGEKGRVTETNDLLHGTHRGWPRRRTVQYFISIQQRLLCDSTPKHHRQSQRYSCGLQCQVVRQICLWWLFLFNQSLHSFSSFCSCQFLRSCKRALHVPQLMRQTRALHCCLSVAVGIAGIMARGRWHVLKLWWSTQSDIVSADSVLGCDNHRKGYRLDKRESGLGAHGPVLLQVLGREKAMCS